MAWEILNSYIVRTVIMICGAGSFLGGEGIFRQCVG